MTLQFRAEVYNISNTPNFATPNAFINGWTEGPQHGNHYPINAGDNPKFCSATTPGCTSVGLLAGDTPTSAGRFCFPYRARSHNNPPPVPLPPKLLFFLSSQA